MLVVDVAESGKLNSAQTTSIMTRTNVCNWLLLRGMQHLELYNDFKQGRSVASPKHRLVMAQTIYGVQTHEY